MRLIFFLRGYVEPYCGGEGSAEQGDDQAHCRGVAHEMAGEISSGDGQGYGSEAIDPRATVHGPCGEKAFKQAGQSPENPDKYAHMIGGEADGVHIKTGAGGCRV